MLRATLPALVLALVPAPASATPLSELAASLAPGSFGELETIDLLPALAEPNGGATGSILPYAEDAVWDATTGRFFFIGSDHIYDGLSSGPRFIAYGDADNTWVVMPEPEWFGSGTMHGYDHAAMLDGNLYQMTLIVDQPIWRYDTSRGSWSEIAALDATGYNRFGGLEPFAEIGGLVYVEATSVYTYDIAGDAWTTLATGVAMGDYHNFAEYNPVHGVVLLGGGNDSGVIHTLDADLELTARSPAPFPLRVNEAVVTVDPNSGEYLVFGGGGEFWTYDVTSDEWLLQDVEVPLFAGGAGPVELTVAGPIDSYGVVMFVKHTSTGDTPSASVFVYRHSPGMGEPPGGEESGSDGADGSSGGEDDSGEGSTGTPADDSGGGDTAPSTTNAATSDDPGTSGAGGSEGGASEGDDAQGCGCTSSGDATPLGLLGLLGLLRRRRR